MNLISLVCYFLVAFTPTTLSHTLNDKLPFEIPEWNYTGHVAGQVYHDVPREYHMIFPIDYDPERKEPYPLIVMIHGSGADAAVRNMRFGHIHHAHTHGSTCPNPDITIVCFL
jgi:poly(3-hydroxybutyrate) depolymerase